MTSYTKIKKKIRLIITRKLIIASLLISVLSSFLAISLKHTTEYLESIFFLKAANNTIYMFVFPIIGLLIIHFLRQYLFKKKENKGITEIFDATKSKNKSLPLYKIPSHFVNGLFTVAFGGSTGIEVSTVVSTAAIGAASHRKENVFRNYKTELICVGITAGITILFSSPIAGILFSMEVIAKKTNKIFFLTNIIALTIASALLLLMNEEPLFSVTITTWHFYAIPYFILLGILAGINSVFLTKMVLFFKRQYGKIASDYHKIIIGALILSLSLAEFPQLYGDGYHAMKDIFSATNPVTTLSLIATILGILILKPIVTSATLASGGDGGVFAPSLFIGAFLGLLMATILNTFFDANVIPINFMVIGMAAVLSASIHAPFTALFLVCGMINDYTLFFPILAVALIAKYTSKLIFPFTVYNYNRA
ncbi:chloride channel protein [Flavobacterium sangjuense]|uniref:Voltage-gated ClC-type chloride channel ClcB n=1 Tax=Flavobacterium sangjuense TaxID=2518177 RepID=A0A4P7PVP4_9FLAO|nr:chloride channel protein [Flavobacterium sangjuense]QBZ98362.1 Voltage-gated ClC-type chloride channel ClcB [Flavobacterium sangjuense]